jgi:transcriptional regulator with XRE-family HTH domain
MIEELKQIFRDSGMSQYDVSRATGGKVVQPELCRWLAGKGQLGHAKLDAVAEALGVKLVVRNGKAKAGVK